MEKEIDIMQLFLCLIKKEREEYTVPEEEMADNYEIFFEKLKLIHLKVHRN